MGGTWSALLLMWLPIASALSAMHEEPLLERVVFLNLIREVLRSELVTSERGAMYLHVDDTILAQRSAGWARAVLRVLGSRLRWLGFVAPVEWPEEIQKTVGIRLFDEGGELAPATVKLGHLDRALEQCKSSSVLCPARVSTILGIYVWFGLLWRPSLAAPSAVYKWAQENFGQPLATAWPSMAFEIRLMRTYAAFMRSSLTRRVLPAMLAQDAAGPGDEEGGSCGTFVLAVGFPSLADLATVWSSRDVRGATVGSAVKVPTRSGALGMLDRSANAGAATGDPKEWIPVSGFRASVVAAAKWFRVLRGSWRWAGHINYGEGRGCPIWLTLAIKIGLRWLWLSDLTDSRVVFAVFVKGRSSPFRYNLIARTRANLEAITGSY